MAADIWDTIIVLLKDPHYYIANLAGVIFCNVIKKCKESGMPMVTPLCEKYLTIAGNHYDTNTDENINSTNSSVTSPNKMVHICLCNYLNFSVYLILYYKYITF